MLSIEMLGGFQVTRDGIPLEGLQVRRAGQLLALLVLEANQRVQRQWIETVLEVGYASLRKTESALRQALGPDADRIKVVNNSLYIDTSGVTVDVIDFRNCADSGDLPSVQKALQLYRGELLKGWEGSWIYPHRESAQELYLESLQSTVRADIAAGNGVRATGSLKRFLRLYPRMDFMWSELIRLYKSLGQEEDARQTYEAYLAAIEDRCRQEGRHIEPSVRVREALIFQAEAALLRPDDSVNMPNVTREHDAVYEPAGGAVPLGSPFYVERPEDALAAANLRPQSSYLLIRGPRQAGKTSLLARLLASARGSGADVVFTDWQKIPQVCLEDARKMLHFLAESIADQLGIECDLDTLFAPPKAPTQAFERFFRRHVLGTRTGWVVWGIDEAERLFDCTYRDDIFGMLRSWHNERTVQMDAGWDRLTVPIAYATETYLITNLSQSPFNVGYRVALSDFTLDHVRHLNGIYSEPISKPEEFAALMQLTGGHPYLVRLTLQELRLRRQSLADALAEAETERSIYRDHLERIRLALQRDPEISASVKNWLGNGVLPSAEHFARLTSAGVAAGASPAQIRPRCELYSRYLERML